MYNLAWKRHPFATLYSLLSRDSQSFSVLLLSLFWSVLVKIYCLCDYMDQPDSIRFMYYFSSILQFDFRQHKTQRCLDLIWVSYSVRTLKPAAYRLLRLQTIQSIMSLKRLWETLREPASMPLYCPLLHIWFHRLYPSKFFFFFFSSYEANDKAVAM